MAAGLSFDPAEFEAFKAGRSSPQGPAPTAPAAPAADVFDANEFQAFKAQRQGGGQQRPTRSRANPFSTVAEAPSFDERFGAGEPMSRTGAAPQVAGDGPRSVGSDQAAADALYAGLRRTADRELIGAPSAGNSAIAGLIGAGQGASLNLAGNIGAGAATALGAYNGADWRKRFGLPDIPGYSPRSFSENYDRVRDLRDAYGRQHPVSSTAGTVAGAVAAAPMMPGLPIAQGAGLATRAGLYGLTGAGYGAAGEAIDSRDPLKTLGAAGTGFAGGAILGPIVEKVAPPIIAAAGKALEPIMARFGRGAVAAADGFTPEARAALRAAGLDADVLPPQLAQHIEAAFAAKGATPAAVREAQAAEFDLPLSRGQATQDPRALALEGRALAGQSGPRAQQIGDAFAARQAEAVAGARDRFMGMAAGEARRRL